MHDSVAVVLGCSGANGPANIVEALLLSLIVHFVAAVGFAPHDSCCSALVDVGVKFDVVMVGVVVHHVPLHWAPIVLASYCDVAFSN